MIQATINQFFQSTSGGERSTMENRSSNSTDGHSSSLPEGRSMVNDSSSGKNNDNDNKLSSSSASSRPEIGVADAAQGLSNNKESDEMAPAPAPAPAVILSNKRGRRRKRQHKIDADIFDGEDGKGSESRLMLSLVPAWKTFQQFQTHSLRINVSDVAASSGFHPYKDLVTLFLMDHVYQGYGGNALLEHDAQLLGIQLKSQSEEYQELAKLAGTKTQKAMEKALNSKASSVEHAETVRSNVCKEATKSNKLTKQQIEILQEGARHSIYTNFGTRWENRALDMYQEQCGWEIQNRNSQLIIWPFERFGDDTVRPMQDSVAIDLIATADGNPTLQQGQSRPSCPKEAQAAAVIDLLKEQEQDCIVGNADVQYNRINERSSNNNNDAVNDNKHLEESTHLNDTIDSNPKCDDERIHLFEDNSHLGPKSIDMNGVEKKVKNLQNGKNDTPKDSTASDELQSSNLNKDDKDADKNMMETEDSTCHFHDEKKTTTLPFFTLRGCVDGIRDELIPAETVRATMARNRDNGDDGDVTTDDDNDSWILKSIIVECKHRMRRLSASVPLYEMIQATVYALMYQVEDADLVQVLRKRKPKQQQEEQEQEETKRRRSSSSSSSESEDQVNKTLNQLTEVSSGEKSNDVQDDEKMDSPQEKKEDATSSVPMDDENSNYGGLLRIERGTKMDVILNGIGFDGADDSPSSHVDGKGLSMETIAKTTDTISTDNATSAKEKADERARSNCVSRHLATHIVTVANSSSTALRNLEGNKESAPQTSNNYNDHNQTERDKNGDDDGDEEGSVTLEIKVDRIRVDDPLLQHRHHWNSLILPRLRSWVDAVYRVRRDDGKRYALLLALVSPPMLNNTAGDTSINRARMVTSPANAWKILFKECPWLERCDTAYHREFVATR